ncbi:hypothetical protein UFOVP146_13 [uncultured Caudovirales phage]|uniref:Uncharacterized protein n=1 Tax=uncultured Caudovirales phage TaxID=2100421 RepID=A0A6J7VKV5_9CAUD|nr:hypothetical protein UFOVP146_13 [uncultured Caudovirales phage]
MKQRIHADLIKAWADGAEIQRRETYCQFNYNEEVDTVKENWVDEPCPSWNWNLEYRIKPEQNPKPKKETLFIYNNVVDGKTFITQQTPDRVIANERYCQYMGSIEVTK